MTCEERFKILERRYSEAVMLKDQVSDQSLETMRRKPYGGVYSNRPKKKLSIKKKG